MFSEGQEELIKKREKGLRTVESLAKVGANSGSRIQFAYKQSMFKGEEISFAIEPPQALKIQETIHSQIAPSTPRLVAADNNVALGEELRRIGSRSENVEMLRTIARVLISSGADHLVSSIANEFEADGNLEAARVLREAAHEGTTSNY